MPMEKKLIVPFVVSVQTNNFSRSFSVGETIKTNGRSGIITKITHVLVDGIKITLIGELEAVKDPALAR